MNNLLLSPPIALSILVVFAILYYAFLRAMTLKNVPPTEGLTKPYACGEEQTENVLADYGAFFPFAFFFTILHVVALTVTTVPVETMGSAIIAVLYVVGALVGLSVLELRMSLLTKIVNWSRLKSPWILHFNSGACNACDIEIIAALTPQYDIERFGIVLKGSPRHADVLVCSGPVTRQVKDRLVRIYEQMPAPKFVLAVGTCACSGGVFKGCYNVTGGIDTMIPVSAYIPGCPASPTAIMDGVVKLLTSLEAGEAAPPAEPPPDEFAASLEQSELEHE